MASNFSLVDIGYAVSDDLIRSAEHMSIELVGLIVVFAAVSIVFAFVRTRR